MTKLIVPVVLSVIAADAAALSVGISQVMPAMCIYPTAVLQASANGGTPPYAYAWSTGGTGEYIEDLQAGDYSVTVTDALSDQATANYTVVAVPAFDAYAGGFVGCPDGVLGPPFRIMGNGSIYQVGMEPHTTDDPNYAMWITQEGPEGWKANYMNSLIGWPGPGEDLDVAFTDANGCPGVVHVTIPQTPAYPNIQVLNIDPACAGGYNGSAMVQVGEAPNDWPHYIHLVHEGTNIGLLEWQSSMGMQMYGQQAQTTVRQNLMPGEYAAVVSARYPYPWEWLEPTFFTYGDMNCGDSIWFTVPEMTEPCGTVMGNVFMDDNDDCYMWSSEVDVPQTVLAIEPGGYTVTTNAYGDYQANLPLGSYTLEQAAGDVGPSCTIAPIPFDLVANGEVETRNVADSALVPRDVAIDMGSGPARPGFLTSAGIGVDNDTPGSTGTVTVTLDFDPLLTYVNAVPNPTDVTASQVTWTLSSISSFGHRDVHANFQVPPNPGLIGTDLQYSATVGIVQPEPNTTNNSTAHTRTITGSYDPNDKTATTSSQWSDTLYFLDSDEWVDYTIRFQNTGTDTAFNVVITDTLPTALDPLTFDMGARSHNGSFQLAGQGVVRFLFPNIDLPDSASNEAASHGFVRFRIAPRHPLLPGTVIENIANIYFDFNPPVITEPSVLTAEFSTGITEVEKRGLRLAPVPVNGSLSITGASRVDEIMIVSSDGREAMRQTPRASSFSIDVSELKAGFYLLIGTLNNGNEVREPFIKQ